MHSPPPSHISLHTSQQHSQLESQPSPFDLGHGTNKPQSRHLGHSTTVHQQVSPLNSLICFCFFVFFCGVSGAKIQCKESPSTLALVVKKGIMLHSLFMLAWPIDSSWDGSLTSHKPDSLIDGHASNRADTKVHSLIKGQYLDQLCYISTIYCALYITQEDYEWSLLIQYIVYNVWDCALCLLFSF